MPSSSAKQHRFMQAVAHSPSFAKKAGVSQSVGKDFSFADKGKTFSKGGGVKKGKRFEEGGDIEYDSDKTYSGRFTDDETGELAENTPTRSTAKAAPTTPARPARAAPVARAAPSRAVSTARTTTAPAAPEAAPKAKSDGLARTPGMSIANKPPANDPLEVFTPAAKARRAKQLQDAYDALDKEAGKTSKTFNKGGMMKKGKRFSGETGKSEVTNPYSGPSDLKDLYKEKYVPEEKAVIAKSKPSEEIAEDTKAVTGMASRKYKNMPSDEKKAESAERIKDMAMAAASLTSIGGLGRVGNAYQQTRRTNAEYRSFKEAAERGNKLNRDQIARGEAATAQPNIYGRRGFTGERATRAVVDRVRDQGFAKGGTIMKSKSMKFAMGGDMPSPGGARPDPRMMAAMRAKQAARQQPMRRPPPGGMPPPAQPPMGMKAGGKVKRYDDGGNVSKEDIAAFGLPTAQKIQENKAENKGYLAGQDKYPAEARLQKDLAAPAKIARKTGVYLKEKYGDVKGNVKGMFGDREALRELRGSQLSREAALGYKKGGMPMKDGKPAFMQKKMMGGGMAYAKGGGIESRGKTKGTVIRMAAGGSVSSRADGIAQRGKTKFTNY